MVEQIEARIYNPGQRQKTPEPSDLPMYQHPSTLFHAFLDEFIASCEILYNVFILDVINIDDMMLKVLKQGLVER